MDLQRVAGTGPGEPGGERLSQAGLDAAALLAAIVVSTAIQPSLRATRGKPIIGWTGPLRPC
jgi:hypothetical protein